jgi:hypothetical protein
MTDPGLGDVVDMSLSIIASRKLACLTIGAGFVGEAVTPGLVDEGGNGGGVEMGVIPECIVCEVCLGKPLPRRGWGVGRRDAIDAGEKIACTWADPGLDTGDWGRPIAVGVVDGPGV